MEIINNSLANAKNELNGKISRSTTDEYIFNYITLKSFFLPYKSYIDLSEMVTDGSNDGGIDFVFYDEEQVRVIIAQSKFTNNLDTNSIISELNKMSQTVLDFIKSNTGSYNTNLKRELQNALDRLPDEDAENVEYVIFTLSAIDIDDIYNKIDKGEYRFSKEMVSIYQQKDISDKLQSEYEKIDTVPEAKILIDKPKNILSYESSSTRGILVNVKSQSIISLYNKYAERGLFDLNIRKFIRNKLVDDGIKKTLNDERDNFWFYNNGIIIACSDYVIDGDSIHITDFSIVNGGQTTTQIGKYTGSNRDEFVVPCKIVSAKNDSSIEFFTKIAETTNSQKPIYARDLKSNSPEMRRLQRWLSDEGIYLEIKRGETKKLKACTKKIKNDDLAQIILSFFHQKPGTSRSGKKAIFENNSIYNKLFKNNYEKDKNKKAFILDIIDLNIRYNLIEEKLKQNGLQTDELIVLKNGKQIIFALMGVLYSLVNGIINQDELLKDPSVIKDIQFDYLPFISNYRNDDLDDKLYKIVLLINQCVSDAYKDCDKHEVTSVSNYFKTDKKYYDDILPKFMKSYSRLEIGKDIAKHMVIFKSL